VRSLAISRRILSQLQHDRRTVALMLVAPILLLTLLGLIFDGDEVKPTLALVDVPVVLKAQLESKGAEVLAVSGDEANELIRSNEVDAILSFIDGRLRVLLEGSDPTKTRAVRLALLAAGEALRPVDNPFEGDLSFLHGSPELSPFDNFGPVLLGFIVFFFTFLVSGVSFVRERTTGTLERMLATPLRRWEIVVGYLLGFAVVVVVQITFIVLVSVFLLDMLLTGSFAWLLVITLLLATTALTLGMLLSAFARTEFQLIQFIPLVIVPQVFFSGLFPLDAMAPWLRGVGSVLPLTYGADAMREVMIRGGGWAQIQLDLLILLGFSLAFLVLNIVTLRRYRRI